MLCLKIAGLVANSVDPDEMPRSASTGSTVCSGLSVQIHMVNNTKHGIKKSIIDYYFSTKHIFGTH